MSPDAARARRSSTLSSLDSLLDSDKSREMDSDSSRLLDSDKSRELVSDKSRLVDSDKSRPLEIDTAPVPPQPARYTTMSQTGPPPAPSPPAPPAPQPPPPHRRVSSSPPKRVTIAPVEAVMLRSSRSGHRPPPTPSQTSFPQHSPPSSSYTLQDLPHPTTLPTFLGFDQVHFQAPQIPWSRQAKGILL